MYELMRLRRENDELRRENRRLREQLHKADSGCTECGQKTAGWKPVFGSFAPEWWATQRERGIDPASGHKLTCSKKPR